MRLTKGHLLNHVIWSFTYWTIKSFLSYI